VFSIKIVGLVTNGMFKPNVVFQLVLLVLKILSGMAKHANAIKVIIQLKINVLDVKKVFNLMVLNVQEFHNLLNVMN
jgi:hypothetical protein